MDKQQAKFLLQSFRPDGGDANEPEFAEALRLAAEDRELGEWLANERAQDAAFAAALEGVEIPEGLRDEILAVLAYDNHMGTQPQGEMDALFVGALANVTPPDGLRDQILAAMEVEQTSEAEPENVARFPFMRWVSVAAAAVITFSIIMITQRDGGSGALASMPLHDVQLEIGQDLHGNFAMDFQNVSHEAASTWFKEHNLPVPISLPDSLSLTQTMGGKAIKLKNGKEVSLISLLKEGIGTVHVIVLNKEDVQNYEQLGKMESISVKLCQSCPVTKWNIATWRDDENAYLMLTRAKPEKMVSLF